MIPPSIAETVLLLADRLCSDSISWAIDGSTSLALQEIDIIPHDIDILTDRDGAYAFVKALGDQIVLPVMYRETSRYRSYFGRITLNGVMVEVMGDLSVYRKGRWSEVMNPSTVEVIEVMTEGRKVPAVSMRFLERSGYLGERLGKGRP